MSEWVDLAIYGTLIVMVWGWLPALSSHMGMSVIADRNPTWLSGHPEIERRLPGHRWFRWSCWLWASLSLGTLLAFQVGLWPRSVAAWRDTSQWDALKDLNSVLLIAGLLLGSAWPVLFHRWLCATVPLAQRRQATLVRRSLDDYVNRPAQYAVYSVVVLHLAAWVAVGVMGRYATAAFWGGVAFQFAISGVFLAFVAVAVRRRPAAVDRILGPRYRHTEVRVAFAAQLLPLMNGTARLYEQVAATSLEEVDRVLHLSLVLVVLAIAVALLGRVRRDAWASARVCLD